MNYFKETCKGKTLVSGREIKKDELVEEYVYYTIIDKPCMHSIQLAEGQHSLAKEDNKAIYIDHSCDPNCYFDV